jgi:large subunit ribosomal protein L9
MKIILQQDVAKLGHYGEVVTVADGYARNFLFPRGMAVVATAAALKVLDKRKAEEAAQAEQTKAQAQTDAQNLEGKTITIRAKAGDSNRLFGSITAQDIVDALQSQYNVQADKRKVALTDPIKTLGTVTVPVRLHSDISVPLQVEVVRAA